MRLLAALALLTLTLTGCESNIERSARLEKLTHHRTQLRRGLTVTRENPDVKVLGTTVVHEASGTAAVVELRSDSAKPLHDVPIAITLHSPGGATLYRNDAPGLSSALVSVPLLLPGHPFDWVDDQIPAVGAPGGLDARVGEAPATSGALPQLSIQGVHLAEEPSGGTSAEGAVLNPSAVAQQEVVVFAIGSRAGRIVAAGRAVLPNIPAHASATFQVFFIGDPRGAKLHLSAPATTPR